MTQELGSPVAGASALISQRFPETDTLLNAFSIPVKDMHLPFKTRRDLGADPSHLVTLIVGRKATREIGCMDEEVILKRSTVSFKCLGC